MHLVTLRYWAGARAAADVETEQVEASSLADALAAVKATRDAGFTQVVDVCSLLVDGRAVHRDRLADPLGADTEVELLPPFAGG